MKVVILAGGFGTRISEESHLKPKPMIEIGEKPILWHIMKMYSTYGFNEFVICCGYKQHVIKEWFADYYLHNSNITFDFTQENKMIVHNNVLEPGIIDLIDGDETVFEKGPLVEAARMGELNAYKHKGFWQCMDTLREKNMLEELWQSGEAPWKIWK